MDYGIPQVYGFFPLSQVGKGQNAWGMGSYGLPGAWVRRVSSVVRGHAGCQYGDRTECYLVAFVPRAARANSEVMFSLLSKV